MNRYAPWARAVRLGAPVRLVCLPYAGGGTADFRRWKDALLPAIDLVPIVLPAREHRLTEAPAEDLVQLAERMSSALAPLFSEAPTLVYGHSMGAWLAFELARALHRAGRAPAHLLLAARRAPHLPPRLPPLSDLPDALFIERTSARYGAIPDVIRNEPEIMKLFLPALRADFRMLDRYQHKEGPALEIPITALHGTEDLIEHQDDVRAWSRHTGGPFEFRTLPGGHFFLRDAIDELTDIINAIARPLIPR